MRSTTAARGLTALAVVATSGLRLADAVSVTTAKTGSQRVLKKEYETLVDRAIEAAHEATKMVQAKEQTQEEVYTKQQIKAAIDRARQLKKQAEAAFAQIGEMESSKEVAALQVETGEDARPEVDAQAASKHVPAAAKKTLASRTEQGSSTGKKIQNTLAAMKHALKGSSSEGKTKPTTAKMGSNAAREKVPVVVMSKTSLAPGGSRSSNSAEVGGKMSTVAAPNRRDNLFNLKHQNEKRATAAVPVLGKTAATLSPTSGVVNTRNKYPSASRGSALWEFFFGSKSDHKRTAGPDNAETVANAEVNNYTRAPSATSKPTNLNLADVLAQDNVPGKQVLAVSYSPGLLNVIADRVYTAFFNENKSASGNNAKSHYRGGAAAGATANGNMLNKEVKILHQQDTEGTKRAVEIEQKHKIDISNRFIDYETSDAADFSSLKARQHALDRKSVQYPDDFEFDQTQDRAVHLAKAFEFLETLDNEIDGKLSSEEVGPQEYNELRNLQDHSMNLLFQQHK
ncbi:unnamed protein product [Amoebophrya sp. A120]|nr:unnamed protein product [Amoebophrya sp. A120]|eukprot:GSA120T00016468001.1